MTQLDFKKGHGTGNDFVLLTDTDNTNPLSAKQIAWLCNRHTGIGADGLIRAVRTKHHPGAAELAAEYPEAEWFMDYYNADGSIAEMCGNGVRVYVHYLITEGLIAPQDRRETIAVATRAGVKDVLVGAAGYSVDLGRWKPAGSRRVVAQGIAGSAETVEIDLGNPHSVAKLDSPQQLETLNLTETPKLTPEPAAGSNIEFVVADDPLINDGVGQIRMRVHERGVGETLSCGTGAVAAALAYRHIGGTKMPHNWRVSVPGGTLGVRMFPTEEGEHVSLSGPATIVYSGTVEVPAV